MIGIVAVHDDDELLMMTAQGKIQRVAAREISTIGRNTQGVRIMTLDAEDSLAAIVRVPREEATEEAPKRLKTCRQTTLRRRAKRTKTVPTPIKATKYDWTLRPTADSQASSRLSATACCGAIEDFA